MNRIKNISILLVIINLLFISSAFAQKSTSLLKREAERHMEAGRYGEAINILNEIIIMEPEISEAYVLRGRCFENRSQYKLAVEDLRNASRLNPNDKSISEYLLKLRRLWRNELQTNINKLEKELSLNPALYNNYLELAEIYYDLDEKEKAENLYREYMERAKASPKIILRYGEILANTNKLKEGESSFKNFVEMYPDNDLIKIRYGYFNLWLGKFSEAETIFSDVLRKNPDLVEAQDGYKQAKVKGYLKPSGHGAEEIKRTANIPINKIEQYKKILSENPLDYKTRLIMIDELLKSERFEESFDQLQIILIDTLRIPVFSSYRVSLINQRDSIFNLLINDYNRKLESNPDQKEIISKAAYYYSLVGNYEKAMDVLSNYFNRSGIFNTEDLRFQYAQYASWKGDFNKSIQNLDYLLALDPGNLDYQLLMGKVLVWSNQKLELAERYLQNNLTAGNQNLDVIITLATLYIQNEKINEGERFLEWAKTIDSQNKEVIKAENLYNNYKKSSKERYIYSLIEEGRKFYQKGDCPNAIIKFDEYFSMIENPSTSELVEYADLYNCTKNLDKAIEIYDDILKKGYNYSVAKLKAKNLLWKKDFNGALVEFQKLSSEKPDDYECKILLGETYQNLEKFSMASSIYTDVLSNTSDKQIISMVNERISYMPQTGFSNLFSNFPSPIGFVPSVFNYSDNQDFILNDIGGRIEVGIARILSGGISYSNLTLHSSDDKRRLTEFKGHLFLSLSDEIKIHGSYGTLGSVNLDKKNVGDASIKYGNDKNFSTEFYYEYTDAATVLYSPYLINLHYDAEIFKVTGFFKQNKKLFLSGYFTYISISDENAGNDFMLRIGTSLIEDAFFGYESRYTNYKYDSPLVPFSNGKLKLYYSPQNLDSHSLWAKWELENNKQFTFNIGGTIGYIPFYDVVLRQIDGDLKYTPVGNLILTLQITAGSSYRFESSYNYFSGMMSVYWQVY